MRLSRQIEIVDRKEHANRASVVDDSAGPAASVQGDDGPSGLIIAKSDIVPIGISWVGSFAAGCVFNLHGSVWILGFAAVVEVPYIP